MIADMLFSGSVGALLILALQVIWERAYFYYVQKKTEKWILRQQKPVSEISIADNVALTPELVRKCCFTSKSLKIDGTIDPQDWERYNLKWGRPR